MKLLTDNIAFMQRCIPAINEWRTCKISTLAPRVAALAGELFNASDIMCNEAVASEHWDYLFAVDSASCSQYDVLSRLAVSNGQAPDRTLCCAGSGMDFHGFKNRSWQACPGNIHLSAFLKPALEVPGGAAGFIIAAAIAALQTVESFELQGAVPAIKWVNDILVDGAKVGGVLARLQNQGPITESVVVGIGLNVEQRPAVQRDPFVPAVAAVADFVEAPETCRHADVFPRLIENLGRKLDDLHRGQFAELLDLYRQHSLVLGREVTIFKDHRENSSKWLARGRVKSIGPALELFIEGHPEPVTNGRLILS
jgi:biotin-[acetyl-CoA-carboxylase] ligase BirA-like protein